VERNLGSYDVAIIGGGVIGWSVAYHLLKNQGSLRVVVLESREASGRGATGKAAGGVRAQFSTPIHVLFSLFSIQAFQRFSQEPGAEIDFRQNGYLLLATGERSAHHLSEAVKMQKELGVPVRSLTPVEVQEFAPYLYSGDVLFASFCDIDGYLDPYAVCAGYEQGARRLGAEARYRTEVVGRRGSRLLLREGGEERELEASLTVLSAGSRSREVARIFDIEIPVFPEIHYLALTEPLPNLPEKIPMVVDVDTTFHFRREGQGILIGYDFSRGNREGVKGAGGEEGAVPYAFLEAIAEMGPRRLPLLAEARIDPRKCWSGAYAVTPDHHGIIGRVGSVVLATGFGGHGVMHAPAVGQAVAEVILKGECCSFDLHPLRPERFEEGDVSVEAFVL
jgi:sarcosine oxidase subunit beta